MQLSMASLTGRKDPLQDSMLVWPSMIPALVSRMMCSPAFSNPSSPLNNREKIRSLGLAQVLGFAKQSGGGVKIVSHVREGTSVKVFLPRGELALVDADRGSNDIRQSSPAKAAVIILVVDDDQAVLRTTIRLLVAFGYTTVAATSGSEALQLITSGLRVDLVLADFAMPEMTGLDLAKTIHTEIG